VSTLAATFDLDLDAIAAAITPRTRVVIVNTPNNPTGRIYPPETLRALAAFSKRHPDGTAGRSTSSRTSRTAASSSTAARSTADRLLPEHAARL